jgi:hypothetical protein
MAGNEDVQNLDLEQILRTLASLPKTESTQQQTQQQSYDPAQVQAPTESTLPYHHLQAPNGAPRVHELSADPRFMGRTPPPYSPYQAPQSRTSTPTIDPATITSWKHGLRCVNKIASQNPNFVGTVQKLMKDQERHVREWESARQRLIEDQKVKRENEKTHRAALSLPGLLDNTAPLRTPEREKEELDQYDKKVYKACRLMVESQGTQLKGLGVPFFGVRAELVVLDSGEPTEDKGLSGQEANKKITKKEMIELQRKMLNHLMEMYGD